jgi:hypothetical protein
VFRYPIAGTADLFQLKSDRTSAPRRPQAARARLWGRVARVQSLFDNMEAEAVPLGARLLDQEATLDKQFPNHSITPSL